MLDLVLAALAERLAAESGMVARETAALPDFAYERRVTRVPSDADFLDHYPCPPGIRAGGLPIIDCDGDEVCVSRAFTCWAHGSIAPGVSTGWRGDQLIYEVGPLAEAAGDVRVGEGREWGAWWPDGRPREWGREAAPEQGGKLRLRWELDGSRTMSSRPAEGDEHWWSAWPGGWLRRELILEAWSEVLLREWWADGSPKSYLRSAARGAPGLSVEWDEGGRVREVNRVWRGRPTGPLLLRTDQGWVVERWELGSFVSVWTPAGFEPPRAGEGLACPTGTWEVERVSDGDRVVQCSTLSGWELGPGVRHRSRSEPGATPEVDRWESGVDGQRITGP